MLLYYVCDEISYLQCCSELVLNAAAVSQRDFAAICQCRVLVHKLVLHLITLRA